MRYRKKKKEIVKYIPRNKLKLDCRYFIYGISLESHKCEVVELKNVYKNSKGYIKTVEVEGRLFGGVHSYHLPMKHYGKDWGFKYVV